MRTTHFGILFVIFALAKLCVVESAPRCKITKKLATQIQYELADILDESKIRNDKVSDNCEEISNKIIHFSSRVRNNLRLDKSFVTRKNIKMQEFQEKDEVKNFNFTLNGVRSQLKTVYQKTYESLITSLDEIDRKVKESLADQLPMRMKIDLYSLIDNHNKLDLDVNPRDNCEITGSKLEKMFEIFNEIRALTHVPVSEDCRDLTRELINLRGIIAITKIHENNLLSALDMRLTTELKLVKNITKFIENDRKDYENLRADFSVSEKLLTEVRRDVDNWKEFLSIQACKTLNHLILTSKNLNILDEAIFECKHESNVDPLSRALYEAYKCDKTKLPQIHNFIKSYSDDNQYRTHLSWLLSEMKKCDQTNDQILLKMSLSNKQEFAEEIDDIHTQIASKLRSSDNTVVNDINEVKNNLDFQKLVVICFDKNITNFDVTKKFIEEYSNRDFFLENDLVEEFYSISKISLANQLRMGFWLKSRLANITQDRAYRSKLEALKEKKLPHVVNVLCFKSFSLTSIADRRNHVVVPGSTNYQVQKLIARPIVIRKELHLTLHDESQPDELILCPFQDGKIRFGEKNSKCFWRLESVNQNGQCSNCVTIVDPNRKVFISSDHIDICIKTRGRFDPNRYVDGDCAEYSFYNRAMSIDSPPYEEQWLIN